MDIRGSRRRVVIELETPSVMGAPFSRVPVTEKLVSPGHVCNYCHGTGMVAREDDAGHDMEYKECPMCKGKGEMDAVVTIAWRPSREHGETWGEEARGQECPRPEEARGRECPRPIETRGQECPRPEESRRQECRRPMDDKDND